MSEVKSSDAVIVDDLLPQQKVKRKKRGRARKRHHKKDGPRPASRKRPFGQERTAKLDDYRPSIQEPVPKAGIVITIRGTEAEKELWWMEAQKRGMSFSAFVRTTMNSSIGVVHVKEEVKEAKEEKKHREVLRKLCVRCKVIGKPSCAACML